MVDKIYPGDLKLHKAHASDTKAVFLDSNLLISNDQIISTKLYDKREKEKSRECHNHKSQPIPDTKRKRKETQTNTRKTNKNKLSTPNEVIAMLKGLKKYKDKTQSKT